MLSGEAAKRTRVSGRNAEPAGVNAVLRASFWGETLIWQARVRCCAGALRERACSSFGRRARSAEKVHVNGCA